LELDEGRKGRVGLDKIRDELGCVEYEAIKANKSKAWSRIDEIDDALR
jgi:hypothetical protein